MTLRSQRLHVRHHVRKLCLQPHEVGVNLLKRNVLRGFCQGGGGAEAERVRGINNTEEGSTK